MEILNESGLSGMGKVRWRHKGRGRMTGARWSKAFWHKTAGAGREVWWNKALTDANRPLAGEASRISLREAKHSRGVDQPGD